MKWIIRNSLVTSQSRAISLCSLSLFLVHLILLCFFSFLLSVHCLPFASLYFINFWSRFLFFFSSVLVSATADTRSPTRFWLRCTLTRPFRTFDMKLDLRILNDRNEMCWVFTRFFSLGHVDRSVYAYHFKLTAALCCRSIPLTTFGRWFSSSSLSSTFRSPEVYLLACSKKFAIKSNSSFGVWHHGKWWIPFSVVFLLVFFRFVSSATCLF